MMHKKLGVIGSVVFSGLFLAGTAGCPGGGGGGDVDAAEGAPDVADTASDTTDVADTTDAADVDGGADTDRRNINLPSLETVETNGFATSKDCVACHSNQRGAEAMRDSEGRAVGPYDLWQASMMANSARDPLWRAVLSAEVKKSPGAADAIQNKCLRCHTPMAYHATRRQGNSLIGLDVLSAGTDLSQIAIDGVSCTACHQIKPDKLGEPSSFTGKFEFTEEKTAFGPYKDVHAGPMNNRNGFKPVQGKHIQDSGLCGSCHTLYTEPIDSQGNSTAEGHFPEQTPFLEWQNSRYGEEGGEYEQSCQGCHEPTDDRDGEPIKTQIARNKFGSDYPLEKVPKRSPYGRHLFVGGNTLVPQMFRDHRESLNPPAPAEAFDQIIERTRRQLEERTATVDLSVAEPDGQTVEVDVGIDVMTGHKFPTGYPARRAWLHVRVTDADDAVVFESGAVDEQGRIVGADGEPLALETVGGPIEPHHETIEEQEGVQIYQSVMANAAGEVNWRLMRAADYYKDNRLLPKGWSSDYSGIEDIAPVGPEDDADFQAGGDRVTYRVGLPEGVSRPLSVEVDLYYQPLSHRFARQLFEVETPAVEDFQFYWLHADRSPETIDSATAEVK